MASFQRNTYKYSMKIGSKTVYRGTAYDKNITKKIIEEGLLKTKQKT